VCKVFGFWRLIVVMSKFPDKVVLDERDFLSSEQARASVFNVFTALLCQPEEDLARNDEILNTLQLAMNSLCPVCSELVGQMREAMKKSTVQELLVEYTRLFIGPFKTPVLPTARCISAVILL
jgi:TorA maturation chaperone TorD